MWRLLRFAVRRLPAGRRDFGEALLAEAATVPSGPRRTWWLLGGFWFLVKEGLPVNVTRRAVGWTALIAVVVWLGLAVEIVLTNVVFPTTGDDDAVSVLLSYLCVFAALLLVGLMAARAGVGSRGQVLAGALAGAVIGLLTVATFAVVDNVWLDIVARQQPKIDGFAHSHAASMRDYINSGLAGTAVGLPIMLGIIGAVLGLAGGLIRLRRPLRNP
jgi:hypothetical protein